MVCKKTTAVNRDLLGVTVVVMAWNEAKSIESVLKSLIQECQKLRRPWELLLIDDGSSDNTSEIAIIHAQGEPRFRSIRHECNLGLGAVYRKAFKEAKQELLTFFPGDGQFSAKLLPEYLNAIDNADLVLGRISARNAPTVSRLLSYAESLLWRLLFGTFPEFQGIMMFRKALLEEFSLISEGRSWVVQRELILRASRLGKKIHHLDIEDLPRLYGESKVNSISTIWLNLRDTFTLWRSLRQFPT